MTLRHPQRPPRHPDGRCRSRLRRLAAGVTARAEPAGRRHRAQDRDDREELDQSGVPVGADRRGSRGQGAVAEERRADRDRLADAADRRRPGAGAAHRAGGQRRRQRDPHLLLRRRQGQRRDQRRRRSRRGGDDLRQRRPGVEALRLLRRGRREDGSGGDGRAREADGRQGIDRDPGRQPERAEPAQARRRREAGGGRVIPGSRSSTPSTTSKRRRTRRPKSCACRTRIRRFRAGR